MTTAQLGPSSRGRRVCCRPPSRAQFEAGGRPGRALPGADGITAAVATTSVGRAEEAAGGDPSEGMLTRVEPLHK